ncbi:MAG: NADH-quinone oxidoreductase subunit J [Clostridia bacterium]|nr:NADH-quinone oxidoreductase subunit J [Clostridia bacterium]
MNITILIILLAGMVVSAAACVMMRNLLHAAIMLAITSAILAVAMFVLNAPLAGVFELSVCAGLITVIFVSAISMTKTYTKEELKIKSRVRLKRFAFLPVVLIVVFVVLCAFIWPHLDASLQAAGIAQAGSNVQDTIWNKRQIDLLGQIIIILAGVFGVVIFFKESEKK